MMSSKSVSFARYQRVRKVHDTALQIYLITQINLINLINFSLERSMWTCLYVFCDRGMEI